MPPPHTPFCAVLWLCVSRQGYEMLVDLHWPDGGRVNMTTENVIDLRASSLANFTVPGDDDAELVALPLWLGIVNPFS